MTAFPKSISPLILLIHGYPFAYERGEIENGILKLRQGKEFFAERELTIFLSLKKSEIPSERVFKVTRDSRESYGTPDIHISWQEKGKELPEHKSFMSDYTMYLEFGKEQNKKLAGKIYLNLPDDPKSFIEGTFDADIKGFRLINGKPDLTSDSLETLEHVAKKYIEEKNPETTVKILEFRDGTYWGHHPSSKGSQTGYIEIKYTLEGDKKPTEKSYLFRLTENGWILDREMKENEIVNYKTGKIEWNSK
jgi:hypothetical protein